MALLTVLHFPDERLRLVAEPVSAIDDELRRLAEDMIETMYSQVGIGLAATQVAVQLRILVMDPSRPEPEDTEDAEDVEDADSDPVVLINPVIKAAEGEIVWPEGCLSVPGIRADVTRAARVVVEAYNLEGEPYEFEAEGLAAVCIQHEIDHLDGKLFIDHLGELERQLVMESYLHGAPA